MYLDYVLMLSDVEAELQIKNIEEHKIIENMKEVWRPKSWNLSFTDLGIYYSCRSY